MISVCIGCGDWTNFLGKGTLEIPPKCQIYDTMIELGVSLTGKVVQNRKKKL